jgi:hypothetical protein
MTEKYRSQAQQSNNADTNPISYIQEMYHPDGYREEVTFSELTAPDENPARIASENLGESNIFIRVLTIPDVRGGETYEQNT